MRARVRQSLALRLARMFFAPGRPTVAAWAAAADREIKVAIAPSQPSIAGKSARAALLVLIRSARVHLLQPGPASLESCCARSLKGSSIRSSPFLPGIAGFRAFALLVERTAQPGFHGGKGNAEHLCALLVLHFLFESQ